VRLALTFESNAGSTVPRATSSSIVLVPEVAMSSQVRSRWVSLPLLIAVLLVTSAGLFAVGVAVEHRADRDVHSVVEPAGPDEHGESGEEPGAESAEDGGEEVHAAESGEEAHARGAAESERLLGVPADSPGTVVIVVVGSVLLAVVVARYPRPMVVATVAVLAAGATVFDVAEVAHQVAGDQTAVAVLAALVAVLHLAVVIAAIALLHRVRGVRSEHGEQLPTGGLA